MNLILYVEGSLPPLIPVVISIVPFELNEKLEVSKIVSTPNIILDN
ncbi:MAG: hypothetical protein IPN09_08705 [Bacteroidetes bacterium]|nr:hypothetical protein [Bacteroidota bacterium]